MCDFSCNCGQVRASYIVNMIQGHHTTKSFTIHVSSSRMVHSSTASLSIPMKGLPTALPICIWKSQVDLMVHVAKGPHLDWTFFSRRQKKKAFRQSKNRKKKLFRLYPYFSTALLSLFHRNHQTFALSLWQGWRLCSSTEACLIEGVTASRVLSKVTWGRAILINSIWFVSWECQIVQIAAKPEIINVHRH